MAEKSRKGMSVDLSKHLVLVVEQDREIHELIRWALRSADIQEIMSCKTGEDALETLREFPADIAVVEMNLHGMNGIELTRRIRDRTSSPNPELPVIMMTGTPDEKSIREACGAGVQNFLSKPFTADALIKRLKSTIRNPRRFISVANYLGPDRRVGEVLEYYGAERRSETTPPSTGGADKTPDTAAKPDAVAKAPAPAKAGAPAGPKKAVPKATTKPALAARPAAVRKTPSDAGEWEEALGTVAEKTTRSQEDWQQALGPEEESAQPGDGDGGLDVEAIIADHAAWSASGGAEGKQADLVAADLAGMVLTGALLANARLRDANLSDVDLSGANLHAADLRHADLSAANLSETDLGHAKLRHAILKAANLTVASLRGADFAGSHLQGANLAGADLKGANFLGADISDADLRGEGLEQEQVGKAIGNAGTKLPPGLRVAIPE